MDDDLVKRLQDADAIMPMINIFGEAAERVIKLEAQVKKLKAALKPFAHMDYWITNEHDDFDTIEECNGLTVAEIRAARMALEGRK